MGTYACQSCGTLCESVEGVEEEYCEKCYMKLDHEASLVNLSSLQQFIDTKVNTEGDKVASEAKIAQTAIRALIDGGKERVHIYEFISIVGGIVLMRLDVSIPNVIAHVKKADDPSKP